MTHINSIEFRTNRNNFKKSLLQIQNNDFNIDNIVDDIYKYDLYNGTHGFLYCLTAALPPICYGAMLLIP